ncbi:MAG TPA: PQQ-binding-like beta-propeller repeat protein [Verrucomicrobiae bacterium]|jgi:outer membrane protein assembly factor BamB
MNRGAVQLSLFLFIAGAAGAQTNWPSFRGDNASGLALDSTTPLYWNAEKSSNVLWKTPVPGLGHSSPVIWGDRLFITTAVNQRHPAPLKVGLYGDPDSAQDDDEQQWRVMCLDKKSGAILWDRVARAGTPKVRRHPKATHANCTMATDGSSVIAFFGSEGLYCFDPEGNLRWSKDFGILRAHPTVYNDAPAPETTAEWEWGFASSPVLYQRRIYVQCDVLSNGFVAALDAGTGKEIWRTRRDDTGTWCTPSICAAGPRPQLVVNGRAEMGGYDLATGKMLWQLSGGGDCPVPTPLVWHDLIFLMSAHGPRSPIYAVRDDAQGNISLKDAATSSAHIQWSVPRGAGYMETPLVYGDCFYSCNMSGILSCFEVETGKQLYKERIGGGNDGFTSSPVASKGRIYFASEEGSVYVVKPGHEFTVLATNQMGEVCMATPAISENTLYYRTQGHVIAIK